MKVYKKKVNYLGPPTTEFVLADYAWGIAGSCGALYVERHPQPEDEDFRSVCMWHPDSQGQYKNPGVLVSDNDLPLETDTREKIKVKTKNGDLYILIATEHDVVEEEGEDEEEEDVY